MANTSGFWDFSVSLYENADVQAACLDLQEQFAADVNVVLFCLWVPALDGESLDRALEAAWPVQRDYIQPLRQMRRALSKSGDEAALRETVAAAELAAEQLEQTRLSSLISRPSGPASLSEARDHLLAYATKLGADQNDFMARAAPLLRAIA